MTSEQQSASLAIKKAAGLLRKVQTMLDENAYCIDVMQQILAVIGLLKSAHQSLLEGHLNYCVSSAISAGNVSKKRKMIDEVIRVSKLAAK